MSYELNGDCDTMTYKDVVARVADDYYLYDCKHVTETSLDFGVDLCVEFENADGEGDSDTITESQLADVLGYDLCRWATDEDGKNVLLCFEY